MMATIGNLSPELLVKIFSHYIRSEGHEAFSRNIPLVCKDWNVHSATASLWRNVEVHNSHYLLNVSLRGLLYETQSLKFDYNCYGKFFLLKNFSAVFENIRDLKALDLASNIVSKHEITVLAENCPHLERLCIRILEGSDAMPRVFDQLVTACGPTLKHLELEAILCWVDPLQQLVSTIAAKCPLLERLVFIPKYENMTPFPIHELRRGCPHLKELEFTNCQLITAGRNDSLAPGFKVLEKFRVRNSNFSGLDLGSLLKDSLDLKHLKLCYNDDLVFSNILNIPSEKIRFLCIGLKNPSENLLETLQNIVSKWRRSLSVLYLDGWNHDIVPVLELLLHDNPSPQLKSLTIGGNVDQHFVEKLIQQCQNLIRLQINGQYYYGREKIEEAFA